MTENMDLGSLKWFTQIVWLLFIELPDNIIFNQLQHIVKDIWIMYVLKVN